MIEVTRKSVIPSSMLVPPVTLCFVVCTTSTLTSKAFSVQTQFAFSRRFLLEIPDSGSVSPFNCILLVSLTTLHCVSQAWERESWAAQ